MNYKYIHPHFEAESRQSPFASFSKVYRIKKETSLIRWTLAILLVIIICLFLPWTQNVRSKGKVTTLRLEDRAQEVNTVIGGRIAQWYVTEGDQVMAGDTLVRLEEVKVEYFDPQLLTRTQDQLAAKSDAVELYNDKSKAIGSQIAALEAALNSKLQVIDNKMQQQKLKITNDSTEYVALGNELKAYLRQNEAAKVLLDSGAISKVEYEKRWVNYQLSQGKVVMVKNKWEQSKQELYTLRFERNLAIQEYTDKIAKARGDRSAVLSEVAGTRAEVAKLQNLFANYDARSKLYYITAPQSGQLSKAMKAGIGEWVKEGDFIAEIVPSQQDKAVEIYIQPVDLPLVQKDQKVMLVFDGYPAIVFSGWPASSYGTFRGVVSFIGQAADANGKFRVMVREDKTFRQWPQTLTIGTAAQGISMLKEVPVYYELWRNINGFPPDYYKVTTDKK
ncbi:MAG TPA: HlyD family efflux transporter periplasmic adaptor subunit [Saprospiraceae bacterium]|nr:HlyD family efflux transporter periplasmic adaptor subunit [Saprospiraceae bacterium]